jgi:hypothetical protein
MIWHTWLIAGSAGVGLNGGILLAGLRGWFGPQYQDYYKNAGNQSQELSGHAWLIPFLVLAIGFILPPLGLVNLMVIFWMVRNKRVCTGKNLSPLTFEEALARKAQRMGEGIPGALLEVARCPGGDHFHVYIAGDHMFDTVEAKLKRIRAQQRDSLNSTGAPGTEIGMATDETGREC